MSTEVDQRVVEMRFDNAKFEKNVQQSLHSLRTLNESLKLEGAEKSFAQVEKAADKVDFGRMQSALDTLNSKFSALQVIGTTALVKLTNQVIDTGEKLVKSLSIDQVTSGWNKYAQKTASVQTIMNATGKSITKVNGYLDKLMWYSDETSYGFTDMTQSLGQLTAAGGDIDKMIPMIMGIANATAYAGKGASEFQRVIYNLNQSYSQGYLNLMDWKSVELAGVATAELKQQIIDTGVALGKIKKGEVTVGTFGSTLSKKWADKTVMETAFGKLADFTMAVKEGVDNGTYKNAAEGIADLADQYDEATVKAFKAAQEAKSFSEAIDATKDAVSSGWMESFEILFGNYDIAKGFWTDLTDALWDLFAAGKDARNSLLSGAFDNGWTQMMKSGLSDVSDLLETGLYQGLSNIGVITDEDVEKAGSFGAAVGEALKKGKLSTDILEKALRGAGEGFTQMAALSDAELKKLGYTREEAENISKKFTDFFEKVDDGTLSISEFADKMTQTSGREHLFNGILNVLNDISAVLQPMKDAFQEILGPTSDGIYKVLAAFDTFTAKLQLSKDTADKLQRVFAGFFSVIKMGLNFIKGFGTGIGAIFTSLSPVGNSLLTLAASVGDYFVALEQSSNITGMFSTVLDALTYVLDKAAGGIQKVIEWITELGAKTSVVFDPLKTIDSWLENFISFLVPKVKWLADQMGEIFSELGNSALSGFGDLSNNAVWGFANAGMIAGLIAGIKGFLAAFKDIGTTVKETVGSVTELLKTLGEAVSAWKNNKNAETLKTIAAAIAILAGSLVVLSMVKPERLAASVAAMTSLFAELLAALTIFGEITKKTKKVGKGTTGMVVMATAVLTLSFALKKIAEIDTDKLLSAVVALGAVMGELVAAQIGISKWAKDGAKHAMSMLAMAAAVCVLADAVNKLSGLAWEEIGKGLVAVGGLLGEVAAFSALSKFSGLSMGKAAGILIMAAALTVLEKAVSAFGKMSVEELQNGLAALGAVLGEIAIFNMLSSAAEHVLSTAVAMTILASGLKILSGAMASLSGMTLEQLGIALGALGGGLLEMGLALTFVKNSLGSAASFLILSVALNALAPPLKTLGGMSLAEIGHGLIALGGAMAIMAAGVGALSLIGPVVTGVALALGFLAASLSALLVASAATNFIDNLSAGLASLQTIRLEAFVNTLMTMGMAVGYFVAGVIAGLGKAIGSIATAISEIIVAICEAVTAAVPAIGNTLAAVITALCDVLTDCLPKIATTLETLIGALCDVLIACTPKILDTVDVIISSVFTHIASKLGTLGKWIGGKVQSAFADEHGLETGKENGQYVAEGYAQGVEKGTNAAVAAVSELAEAQDKAYRDYWGIASPAQLGIEDAGYIVGGLNQGIRDNMGAAETTMTTLASRMDGAFRDELGIHSNSDKGIEDGQFFVGGVGEGIANRADALCTMMEELGRRAHNSFRGGFGLGDKTTTVTRTSAEIEKELESMVLTPEYRAKLQEDLEKARAAERQTASTFDWGSFWGSLTNPDKDTGKTTPTTTPTTTTTTHTGKEKTKAELIQEEYKEKLEANKLLRDTLDEEYALWYAENQYSASGDELMAHKAANAAEEIANQEARVLLAKQQYEALLKESSATDNDKKQAKLEWVQEQTKLAELKAAQYTDLYEEVAKRYDTELDQLEKDYSLWSATNERTATRREKLAKENQLQKDELEKKTKQEENAKKQYEELEKLYGKTDLRTIEAYNDWVDAQTESQQLRNDIARQQLTAIELEIDELETMQKGFNSRMERLQTVYNDGDLSGRTDAYRQAVETYGKDSREARAAQLQGTVSGILGVTAALEKMNFQLQYTKQLEEKLAAADEADKDDVRQEIEEAKSTYLTYAEALADAFNLDDSGKRALLKLANRIQENREEVKQALETGWSEVEKNAPTAGKKIADALQRGFEKAGAGEIWTKLAEEAPEWSKTLSKAFGKAMTEEGLTIGTECISTVVALMQGDWANALASGINATVDFLSTETGEWVFQNGKQLLHEAGEKLLPLVNQFFTEKLLPRMDQLFQGKLLPLINQYFGDGWQTKLLTTLGEKLLGDGGLLELAGQAFGKLGLALTGSGGLAAAFTELGGVITAFVAEFWPVILGVLAVAVVLAGIALLAKKSGKKAGESFNEGVAEGAEDTKKDLIEDLNQTVLGIGGETIAAVRRVTDDEFVFEPCIRPVVDLTDVDAGADAAGQAFAAVQSMSLDGSVSRELAAAVDMQAELQNGARERSAVDLLGAVNALGEHMDRVGESIKGMQMVVDGRRAVGYIDTKMGERYARKVVRR